MNKAIQYLKKVALDNSKDMDDGELKREASRITSSNLFLIWAMKAAWDLPSAMAVLIKASNRGKLGRVSMDLLYPNEWDT